MAEFIERYPLKELTPADYNPRIINEDAFEILKESLRAFGVAKPIIVNANNGVLVAGHQRTRAMKELGMEYAPAILIRNASTVDEIRFNLSHNVIETNMTDLQIPAAMAPGFNWLHPSQIECGKNGSPMVVKEIGRMFAKFGGYGSIVATDKGRVICNAEYAFCMKLLGEPVLAYVIDDAAAGLFLDFMAVDYGEYSYDVLNLKSYNQLYCQMNRLESKGSCQNYSEVYDALVIPYLTKTTRVIDFGAGKCAYPKKLKALGYNVLPYEPHIRKGKSAKIDGKEIILQIKRIEQDVIQHGLYDITVLDSVLNSIISMDLQHKVLLTCNALTKATGSFVFNCRDLAHVQRQAKQKKDTGRHRQVEYLDKDNMSVVFSRGLWTAQRFHSKEGLQELLEKYFDEVDIYKPMSSCLSGSCTGPKQFSRAEYKEALEIEFNMELPGRFYHNKHEKLVESVLKETEKRKK